MSNVDLIDPVSFLHWLVEQECLVFDPDNPLRAMERLTVVVGERLARPGDSCIVTRPEPQQMELDWTGNAPSSAAYS